MTEFTFLDPVSALAKTSQETPYDAVIVGGGSAGLTAAMTLVAAGKRVAVLEAGPARFLTHLSNTEIRYTRNLVRQTRGGVTYSPRLPDGSAFGSNYSCLGGRGLFWNGSAPRFQPHDFEGWPIDSSELEEDYGWAEHAFRVTDLLGRTPLAERLLESFTNAGVSALPGPFAADLDPIEQGALSSGIASILAPFFRELGESLLTEVLDLATRTQVLEIIHESGAPTGVRALDADGAVHFVHARSVVIAAGGIESIRLAAASELPDPHHRIGVGIQDHLFYRCYLEGPHLYEGEGPQSAILHFPAASQTTEQWELQAPGRLLFTADGERNEWNPAPGPLYRVMIRAFAATEKRDDNRVLYSPGPLGSATVHFTHSTSNEERKASMEAGGVKLAEAIGTTVEETRFFPPGASYHEAGGMDMGTDPASSVTDARGSMHGMENVVVVDASAFPRIGATNPHLTIVAESRRKSRLLAARL